MTRHYIVLGASGDGGADSAQSPVWRTSVEVGFRAHKKGPHARLECGGLFDISGVIHRRHKRKTRRKGGFF